MIIKSIGAQAVVTFIILSLFFAPVVNGQSISEKEFFTLSSQIARQTQNNYTLIRTGSNKSPSILAVNRTGSTKTLQESIRNDLSSVSRFAMQEARYIAKNALSLPEIAALKETGTSRTENLWLSSYAATYEGIPLRERSLQINIGALNGEVIFVRNNIPAKSPNSLSPNISTDEVIRQTIMLLGTHSEIKSVPQLVFVDENGSNLLRLCYELKSAEPEMHEYWRLTFDATTGELVEKKSLLEHSNCFSGEPISSTDEFVYHNTLESTPEIPLAGLNGMVLAKVHLHTPFDSLKTVGLPYVKLIVNGVNLETDSTGSWKLPSGVYPAIIQTSFDSRFFTLLRQDAPNSSLLKTIVSGSANVLWDNSNSDPAERDVYYSASFAHLADKRQDMKLTNLDLHMKVNVNINASCNAYYTPDDTSLNFFNAGSGCSNTGEIPDVVFHEYGHHVTHVRYAQAGAVAGNLIDGSLGEAFADLNSAFIRDDPRIGIGFYADTTKLLRTCNNTKKWPKNISPDIHTSGLIITGAFWDLRKTIGLDAATHLFHFMQYQMPDGNGSTDSASLEDAFSSTLMATIITDDNDNNLSNGTPHLSEILAAFKLHNITLSKYIDLLTDHVKDQDTSATSYKINVTASYSGAVGALDQKSVTVFYSANGGSSYTPITPQSLGGNEYEAIIPKVPSGTIVKYYASAASTLAETDTVRNPAPSAPYSFLVGFKEIIKDNAEQNTGWSLSDPSDTASTGKWVREKPHGTLTNNTPPLYYIQQDTDHSPVGTMCYITGNKIDPTGNNIVGYDDVDNGADCFPRLTLVIVRRRALGEQGGA